VKPKTRGTADLLVAVTKKPMGLPYRPALDKNLTHIFPFHEPAETLVFFFPPQFTS